MIYRLFSTIFVKEPTFDFLRLLQEGSNKKLFESFGIDPLSDIKDLSAGEQVEAIAVEYARLFLVPGSSASPRESIQRGEKTLWGAHTVEVNELYKKFGFELDDSFKDTPGHLSAELGFLAELSALEAEYGGKNMEEASRGVRQVKKHFLDNHILKWFMHFKNEVDKSAKLSYYKEMTRFLGMMLDEEVR